MENSTLKKINSNTHLSKNSKESNTKEVLLSLMKEVNFNPKLQNELLQCVSARKSFPFKPKDPKKPKKTDETVTKPKLLKLPPKPIQRSKVQIERLGSYEIEKYRPNPSKIRPPEEKERFQNMMAFGKDINVEEKAIPRDEVEVSSEPHDLFNEILLEIKERKDFLHDMHQLGLAKKYLPEIQSQISQRLKELEKLDQNRAHKVVFEYGI